MTSTLTRYRNPFVNVTSQAINPMQRRAFANYAQRARQIARRTSNRFGRGRTRVLYKRKYSKTTPGILGGTNADNRLIYRKKSMPRKKKRRWRAFVKKINFIEEKELGTRTVLFNDQINVATGSVGSGTQGCLSLAQYPCSNDQKGWLNDLAAIGGLENTANPTSAAGGTINENSKIMFHSAVMDVTIRNVSTVNNGTTDLAAPEAALELDVYEIIMRKETSDNANNFYSLSALLNTYDEPEIGGTGTGIAIQDRGATPFEFGSTIARWGLKILKKTKYFIPNGQTITFQNRDPKRRVCRYGDLTKTEGFNMPGWTRHYYLIWKLVPGLTQGTTATTYKASIAVGSTRKYMYKVEGFNEPRERLLGASYAPGNPT